MNDSQNYSTTDSTDAAGSSRNSDYEYLKRIFENRRSTRAYSNVKPDTDQIRELIGSARYAPNSCNLQHYGFIYVDDDSTLKAIGDAATHKVSWAPALIVAIDDTRFSRGRRAGLQSLAAAIENIFLAATARGMGACWMAGFRGDDAIKKILGIPPHFEVTGLMSIGFPDDSVPHEPTVRLETDDYLHINKFERKAAELITSTNVDRWPMEKLISYRERIGSVYAPRKRISLYHGDMVDEAANIFTSLASRHTGKEGAGGRKLLDVASYDGCFIRALQKRAGELDLHVSTADYSDYFPQLLRRELPDLDTILLTPRHEAATGGDASFDFLSLVFKAEFLPDRETLLRNLARLAGDDGRLFVTSVTAGTLRAVSYRVDRLLKRANVYERNKLYHFGPYRHLRASYLEGAFRGAGWRIEERGRAGRWPDRTFRWWWLAPR